MFNFHPGLPLVLFNNHSQFVCMWYMYTCIGRMMYDTYMFYYIGEIKGYAAGWQMGEL